jgi:hypothetical protein
MVALQRMVAAYHALGSAEIRSESDTTLNYGYPSNVHQSTTLKFEANPPRLSFEYQDPRDGTVKYFADGTGLIYYTGATNQFVQRSARPSLRSIVAQVDHFEPQVMSPMQFLVSDAAPPGVESARIVGRQRVGDHEALEVDGLFTDGYMRQLSERVYGVPVAATRKSFTLWVDASNYLLLKSAVHFGWQGVVKAGGNREGILSPRMDISETVSQIVQNPRFAVDEFRFLHPQGVHEVVLDRGG